MGEGGSKKPGAPGWDTGHPPGLLYYPNIQLSVISTETATPAGMPMSVKCRTMILEIVDLPVPAIPFNQKAHLPLEAVA